MTLKSKYDMYYGASQEILEKAKSLRESETKAEKLVWEQLKSKKINGYKFRRQHPVPNLLLIFTVMN